MEIYEIIKLLIISYVLSDLANFIGEVVSNYTNIKNKLLKLAILVFSYIMTCSKCSSFWITLILSGDLFISALTALLIDIIKRFEYKWIKTKL